MTQPPTGVGGGEKQPYSSAALAYGHFQINLSKISYTNEW